MTICQAPPPDLFMDCQGRVKEEPPDFYSRLTQEKRDRAEYIFNKFGPAEPPRKRPYNLKPFRYINAIPQ